jgi:hypothetical protein
MTQNRSRTGIDIEGFEFATAREAIAFVRAGGLGVAIRAGGKTLVVWDEDASRLAASGAYFAYLHERHGRIISVPVNG